MLVWLSFLAAIGLVLAVEVGVANRRQAALHPKEALAWTGFWIALAQVFNAYVFVRYSRRAAAAGPGVEPVLSGWEASGQFFAAYTLEKLLSLDNILVIALIFAYFRIPGRFQHRLLLWGIAGALVLRGLMISLGVILVESFGGITYVFAIILLVGALAMLIRRPGGATRTPYRRLARIAERFAPATDDSGEGRFFRKIEGVTHVTPLFLVLILVWLTDLVFAVHSAPVAYAATEDPFIIYSANVFALLGLRSLYFAFAGMLGIFRYVQASFLVILVFIAVKMLLVDTYPVPLPLSVGFVAIAIAGGVGMSVARAARHGGWDFALLELEPGSLAPINQRQAKRIIALVVGTTLLLFGTAMLVLPGPGILTIGGGLAVLSSEVVWARRLLNRVRRMLGMDALPDPPEEKEKGKGD